MKTKIFKIKVFVKYDHLQPYNPETDYTPQSLKAIDIDGYSHFSTEVSFAYHCGFSGFGRWIYFRASSRKQASQRCLSALGDLYWPGFCNLQEVESTRINPRTGVKL